MRRHVVGSKSKRAKRFIVKIQRPLESNEQDPPALIYNEDRTLMVYWPMDAMMKRLIGGEFKVYWWAFLDDDKVLHLDRPAEEQSW